MGDLVLLEHQDFQATTVTKEYAEIQEKREPEALQETLDQREYKGTACKDQRAQRERSDRKVKSVIPGSRPSSSCLRQLTRYQVKLACRETRERLENGESVAHEDSMDRREYQVTTV